MLAKKAIEHLKIEVRKKPLPHEQSLNKALKIGIEAIYAYLKGKEAGWYPPGYKLPSETEE